MYFVRSGYITLIEGILGYAGSLTRTWTSTAFPAMLNSYDLYIDPFLTYASDYGAQYYGLPLCIQ